MMAYLTTRPQGQIERTYDWMTKSHWAYSFWILICYQQNDFFWMSRWIADRILKTRKANFRCWWLSTQLARTYKDQTRYSRDFRMKFATSLKLMMTGDEREGLTLGIPPEMSKVYLMNSTGVIRYRYFTVSILLRRSLVPQETLTSAGNFSELPSMRLISFWMVLYSKGQQPQSIQQRITPMDQRSARLSQMDPLSTQGAMQMGEPTMV